MTHLTVKIHEETPKEEVRIRQSWADIVGVTRNKCKCHVVLWRQRGYDSSYSQWDDKAISVLYSSFPP